MTERECYWISTGTVQAIARCDDPFWYYHFGFPEYDRAKPIITDSIRQQAEPIIAALNAGTLTQTEAESRLDAISF